MFNSAVMQTDKSMVSAIHYNTTTSKEHVILGKALYILKFKRCYL